DNGGNIASGTATLIVVNPPSGIVVTNISTIPMTLTNKAAHVAVFQVTAKDIYGGTITNVSLNLSSLSGPAIVKMINTSGTTLFSYTYTVPAGLSTGSKRVLITAFENIGNLNTNHSAFLSVIDGLSHWMRVIYRDATNAITGTWKGKGMLQEVTNLSSPAAYEGIK